MLEIIQEQIESGVYPQGKRLPSERLLAAQFKVPQSRVHQKLQQLVRDGVLECFRGNGYFVRQRKAAGRSLSRIALCWESVSGDMPNSDDFYIGQLLNMAADYGQHIIPFVIPRSEADQESFFQSLLSEEICGVICFPHLVRCLLPALLEIRKRRIPLIFWDYSPLPGIFSSVGQDHFGSCVLASERLAECGLPVNAIGFDGMEQNRLKREGLHAGSAMFHVSLEKEIYIPYEQLGYVKLPEEWLRPGKLYFTMTRYLSGLFIGEMLDRGFLPGRDYGLLTIDRVKFMDGSNLQLDAIMRDQQRVLSKLLEEMRLSMENPYSHCMEWREPMNYIPGNSLKFC